MSWSTSGNGDNTVFGSSHVTWASRWAARAGGDPYRANPFEVAARPAADRVRATMTGP